jgi:hypothetical protein
MVMHFFFLSSIIWMSFLIVDLALRCQLVLTPPFGSTWRDREATSTRNTALLSCVAWGVPAFVLITQTIIVE